ncbi:MAG: hypothetical protein KC897_13775, partial [Candidatus Omnitrophica bacterium]|nr:hypothetical protein [Candidatus Omnitrophota bacterium]
MFEVTGGAGSEVVSSVDASAPYTTADFVFGSPQLADDGDVNHDARMFFDKSKGAFRAGSATGSQWDNANVGTSSIALGSNNTASGAYSTALGSGNTASGSYSTAVGSSNTASGDNSSASGSGNTASGNYSATFGNNTMASGIASLTTGSLAQATGDFSVAFGLQSSFHITAPKVSGDRSMALFFDGGVFNRNNAYDLTATDTLALIGGELMIDDDGSSAASKGCIKYDSATSKLKFSHDCSTYSDFGSATETNDLEGDGAANIADTEVFIGTGAGTGNYVALSGDATLANDGTLSIAADALDWDDFKDAMTLDATTSIDMTAGDL